MTTQHFKYTYALHGGVTVLDRLLDTVTVGLAVCECMSDIILEIDMMP